MSAFFLARDSILYLSQSSPSLFIKAGQKIHIIDVMM